MGGKGHLGGNPSVFAFCLPDQRRFESGTGLNLSNHPDTFCFGGTNQR
jgi:hypothetical protein